MKRKDSTAGDGYKSSEKYDEYSTINRADYKLPQILKRLNKTTKEIDEYELIAPYPSFAMYKKKSNGAKECFLYRDIFKVKNEKRAYKRFTTQRERDEWLYNFLKDHKEHSIKELNSHIQFKNDRDIARAIKTLRESGILKENEIIKHEKFSQNYQLVEVQVWERYQSIKFM